MRVILVVDCQKGCWLLLLLLSCCERLVAGMRCTAMPECRMLDGTGCSMLCSAGCWLLHNAALLMAETCADDAQLFCWQRGHERVANVNLVCCTLLVACNTSPTALRCTCQTCSVGMNEVTMEAMQ